jgi:hypothetical protein
MGDNNRILVDDNNIWLFPSRMNDYPALAIGEFESGNEFTRFGVHWQFGDTEPWVLATYFDNNSNFSPWFDFPIGLGVPSQNNRIHAFYARNMGSNKFGARLSVYHSSERSEDTGVPVNDESFSYYEGSAGLTSSDNSWDIAVTAGFGTWTDKLAFDSIQSEPDGLIDFAAVGRLFWEGGTNRTWVPHAGVAYHKQGEQYFNNSTVLEESFDFTELIVDVGIGQVYAPSANVEAVLDLGLALDRFKLDYSNVAAPASNFEDKETFTVIPFFKLGLDAEVFSWLDARFGATSFWVREKDEFTQGATVEEDWFNFADNATFLGFGFHWGNLHVDTYTDPELFLDGFDFISGRDGEADMNFQISAVYDLM